MGVFRRQGNWRIDFYHQGKRVRRKVGPSQKVAEMALADVEVKKAKQEFLGVCEPKRVYETGGKVVGSPFLISFHLSWPFAFLNPFQLSLKWFPVSSLFF